MKPLRRLLLAAAVAAAFTTNILAETRIALVIGNARYADRPLTNPVNDARLMEATLVRLGFKVDRLENATLDDMTHALRAFLPKASSADVSLFYYAGHGVQVSDRNYLIPVDNGNLELETQLPKQALDATAHIVEALDRRGGSGKLSVVILDACRSSKVKSSERGFTSGLAEPARKPEGMLLAFSTNPGQIARDNPERPNSRYTESLVEAMRIPGFEVKSVFARVRDTIATETRDSKKPQTPWFHSSASSIDFCFARAPDGRCGGITPPPLKLVKLAKEGGARGQEVEALSRALNDPLAVALYRRIDEEAMQLEPGDLKPWFDAANRGDRYATTVLGFYYLWKDKTYQATHASTKPEAIRWLRRAADQGYAPAEYELGLAYASGYANGRNDDEVARLYYDKGLKKNYALAQFGIAGLVEGTEPAKAVALYRQSAEQGWNRAMDYLAHAYLKGRGVERNPAQAAEWARKSYELGGSEMSQHLLGYLYVNRLIQPKDDEERIRLVAFSRLREPWGQFMHGIE